MSIDKFDIALISVVFISLFAVIFSSVLKLTPEILDVVIQVLYAGLVALGFKKTPQSI